MEKLKTVINKYWKVYVAALILATVCDLIGTLKFNIGIGTLAYFQWYCHDLWRTLGPDITKLFKTESNLEKPCFSSPCTFYGKNGNLSRWKSCKTGCCRTCALLLQNLVILEPSLFTSSCTAAWSEKRSYRCLLFHQPGLSTLD